jgi:type IV pilus assembly protein PilY1
MKLSIKNTWLAIALAVSGHIAWAEDIDLFLGNPTSNTSDLPNVLILLDNTANWNTAFNNEKAALVATFAGLPVDKFNVGLMMFSDPAVGHIRAAIRPMTAANRALYADAVDSLSVGGDRANARTLGRNMSEAWRYLNGLESTDTSKVKSSNNSDRDYAGNTSASTEFDAIHALGDNALSGSNATTYTSDILSAGCGDTYIIYIGNTVPSGNVTTDNSSRNSAAGNELADAVSDAGLPSSYTNQIPLTYNAHQSNYADEWARFMGKQGIKVYTVDVDPTPRPGGHNRGMGNSDLIESMAVNSGGKYFRVDSSVGGGAEIQDALSEIFSEIQSVNTVFASVALPASATTQSTFLNQVFIGMFRPDAGQNPRWFGNLKQYRLGLVGLTNNKQLKLLDAREGVDAMGDPVYYEAINSSTGFITECAESYWTPSTADTYWASPLIPQGDCGSGNPESNTPDGPVVEKGGQAYMRRSTTTRTVYTCNSASGKDCAPSGGVLGVHGYGHTSLSTNPLVNWAVGLDVDNEDARPTPVRSSVHGDVIHARPVALNYGTDASPEVAVFYGGNDGLLRAVNGNRTVTHSGVAAGGEFWAFKPLEFDAAEFSRLRTNTDKVKFPATGTNAGIVGTPKDYGMDGAVVAFDGTLNNTDKKFIYTTLRRGGRAVYAFDVTTITSPTLLWRMGCEESLATSANCTTGATNIGQTWSPPSVTFLDGYDDGVTPASLVPLLLMGGGYDTCEDTDLGTGLANNDCLTADKGDSIYVINGVTGAILKEFSTLRAVPGAVTVVPVSKNDPKIKFAYASDTGGNVYRISGPIDGAGVAAPIGSTLPASWEMTQIASLGCATATTSCNPNRKFLFGPDVVEPDDASAELYVLLGSGDREKPLLAYGASASVQNYAFAIVDKPSDGTWLLDNPSASCGASMICIDALTSVTVADGVATGVTRDRRGWKLPLAATEQVVSSSLTAADTVYFSTHIPTVPAPGSCDSNLGVATTYQLDYTDGEGNAVNIIGGGLVPSPVAGKVVLDDGTIVPFCIGCGGEESSIGGMEITSSAEWDSPTGRVYMRIEK